jgi:acyl carrier protein
MTLSTENTLQILRKLVVQKFDVAPEQVQDEQPFTELGLDSLSLVDLIFQTEDHFGVTIDYELAIAEPTLAGLAKLVVRLSAEKNLVEA